MDSCSCSVHHYIYFPHTEGETGWVQRTVRECEGCEEAEEGNQAVLGQVSILKLLKYNSKVKAVLPFYNTVLGILTLPQYRGKYFIILVHYAYMND